MFEKPFIDAGDIAPVLGWSRPWFRRKLKSLIDDHAFPSPLPGGRWHAQTVENWITRYGEATTAHDDRRPPEERRQVGQHRGGRHHARDHRCR